MLIFNKMLIFVKNQMSIILSLRMGLLGLCYNAVSCIISAKIEVAHTISLDTR